MLMADKNGTRIAALAIKPAQQQDGLIGHALQPPGGHRDSGFRPERQSHGLPPHGVDLVSFVRKFGALAFRAAALGAAHQNPPPPVWGGVADGAEQRLFGWRVKRAGPDLRSSSWNYPCSAWTRIL
jgi:hypothetical protein